MAAQLVGGAFLSSAFQVLFDRLASSDLLRFFRKRKRDDMGEKQIIDKLKSLLRVLNKVLHDAEKQQVTDQSVKDWMDDLKDVVYHADDLLDEIATEALQLKVESGYQSGPNQVPAPISTSTSLLDAELLSKIEKVVYSLESFAKQKDDLGLKEVASPKWSHRLPTTSLVDESCVFGRGTEKEEIIKLLVSDEQSGSEINVIPIVGMGGIGKTTLAQLVYNDGKIVEHFEMKAWVCVSEEFDVFRATETILEAVTSRCQDLNQLPVKLKERPQDLNQLQVKLKESLRGKKFLIVLDDVWNENLGNWEILRAPFTAGACGSKIIVTTRNDPVASIMKTIPVHRLAILSEEDCWSLFAKIAFYKGDFGAHPQLEEIGKKIVIQRCKGVPLAVKTLAGLLRSTLDVEEWNNVLTSELWDLEPKDENSILRALKLSYHYLPSHLKQCFAYCSLFPKDWEFEKEKIVLLWIAQDFVKPKCNKTLEKVGDGYFHDLLSRSFFQQASGNKSSFVMHDLVHDVAKAVSKEFIVSLADKKLDDIWTKVRHFSYVQDRYDDLGKFKAIKEAKWLRTFLALENKKSSPSVLSKRALDEILPTLQCSRVLSLSHYRIAELPNSIGNLMHLRYLDLSRTNIKQLPDTVCTFYNLQTLLLSYCHKLTTLPLEIGKLISLRHLDISGTNLREMPVQIAQLKGLQCLTDFVVGKGNGSSINGLREFHHLRGKLCLSRLENVLDGKDALEAKLKEKNKVEKLVLKWRGPTDDSQKASEVLENLEPHKNLKSLTITNYWGTRFPKWLGCHSCPNIVSLFLFECDNCFSLPSLGQLPSLKELKMVGMKGITRVGEEFYGDSSSTKPFQSLETLCFVEMWWWVDWHILGDGEFSKLRKLCIIKCPKLIGGLPQDLPSWVRFEIQGCIALKASLPRSCAARELVLRGCDGIKLGWQDVPSLGKLEISSLKSLKELTPEVFALTADDLPSSHPLSEEMEQFNTSLENIELEGCDCFRQLPLEFFPKLRFLIIRHCEKFETLSIPNGGGLHNLTSVTIWDCHSIVSFPRGGLWAPNLSKLGFMRCSKLKALPEQMQTLLPSLQSLDILECPEIESFPEGGLPSNLRELQITYCKKLVDCRREWGLQRLLSLTRLTLDGVFDEEDDDARERCFPEEGLLPSTLTWLDISGVSNLKSLNNGGLQPLCCLKELHIKNCPKLQSLPERGLPASLEILRIYNCPQPQPLPEEEEGFPASLREIRIEYCNQLQSLPERGLPASLQLLSLSFCDQLQSLPGRGLPASLEILRILNCRKLQSLPEEEEGFPASLRELCVYKCNQLQSLPERGLPASLQRLSLYFCHHLQSLSERGLPASLKELRITFCPQLQAFPQKGLPSSLTVLEIYDCPLLKLRCQRDRGDDWHKIAHITAINIDGDII